MDVSMQARAQEIELPERLVRTLRPVYERVKHYHDYEVRGLEHLPQEGAALLVFTHSLATYDILMLGAEVYLRTGRVIAALTDRRVMQTPLLSQLARALQAVEGEPGAAKHLLDEGRLVGVAPGGMREALRSSDKRFDIDWERRYGFVRLAIETQTPIVLCACPHADELYTVVDNPLTRAVYERLRWPLPLAFGRAFTIVPRKKKLVHHLSAPIVPPASSTREAPRQLVVECHAELVQRMRGLIHEGVS
jgi:1-acyl-sn-glycerol-3-phosphate acyltransferase